jgi:amino acid adenylation domain-containing protein
MTASPGRRRAAVRAALRRAAAGIGAYPDEQRLVPSAGQERLWFLDRLSPGGSAYNVPLAFRLHGPLDAAAMCRALGAVVARHESLRSNIVAGDGTPVLTITSDHRVTIAVDDIGDDSGGASEQDWLDRHIREPFDLARDPLVRARLARLGAEEHLLLVVIHHAVCDGWSQEVLVRELSTAYEQQVHSGRIDLPPLPVQYPDFAAWQRDRLAERSAAELAHWREHLAGAPESLELPTDFPRPSAATLRGDDVPVPVSPATSRGLRELASAEGTTLFPVLLAAFQTLLGRYTGGSDVVVGTPMAGRVRGETEGLIGFFVNTVPLRVDVGGVSVRELVARCQEATLAAQEHQELPLELLADRVRGTGHDTLVRALVQLDGAPRAFAAGGVDWTPVAVTNGAARFDLDFMAVDGPELTGWLRYARDLFTRETAERVAGHLGLLLAAFAEDPERSVPDIPLWTDEELALVRAANDTSAPVPDACLHDLVAEQVARTPDLVAVADEDTELTFRELDRRANRLAHRLRELGAGPDVLVGVCLARSADLVVALLGVLKAGAGYLPLEPDLPPGRLARVVADARPVAVVTETGAACALRNTDRPPAVLLDEDDLTAFPGHAPATGVTPDATAYVIYTSGSTGSPKGVVIPHRAVVNHHLWLADVLGLGRDDVVLQKTPFGFDVSVWELFLPLMTGARMVLARPGGHRDPRYLAELIDRAGVTAAHFVPSMLRAFADAAGIPAGTSLRVVICSGEALPGDLRDRVLAGFDGDLLNLYGPTETTIHSTGAWASTVDPGAVAPIGAPVWNTTAHVLDADGRPSGFGLPGELYHGGAAVGRGYLHNPRLTAERFVPDPAAPGGRLYATGDVVRWRPDGTLEFLGRTDHQVKVNGQRIEPAEIAAALAAHPAVGEVAVRPVTDGAGTTTLAAYLTVTGPEPAPAELRAHLRDHLPAGWVPQHFVVLAALPRTANGKLDRDALPAPGPAPASSTPPRTDRERTLAGIWAEVLGRAVIGADGNFFDLGGHSLQLIQVLVRLERVTGVRVPVQVAFEAATLADLARYVDEQAGGDNAPARVVPRSGPAPLSYGQQRLWFLDRLVPGSPAYNVQQVLALPEPLDVPALRAALTGVVRRHEILRTVYASTDSGPAGRVLPAGPVPLPEADLTAHADQDHAVRAAADDEARLPFDLAEGPLLRARLLRLAERSALVLTMHHIVTDGWSLGLLVDELTALYHGRTLPEPTLQYGDYAAWQRDWMSGERLAGELDHWRSVLDGAPAILDLPGTRVRPPVPTYRGGIRRFTLDADLTSAVRAVAREHGATPFMVLLTGFTLLLARFSGKADLVVGTPVAGRATPELEGLPGFFVNTVALRADLTGTTTFADALAVVADAAFAAYEHQDVPFEKVVEASAPNRDLAHQPFHQVMFELHAPRPAAQPWAEVLPVGVSNDTVKNDLTLVATDAGDRFDCGLRFATDVFAGDEADVLAEGWRAVVAAMVADPSAPHADVSLLTAAGRAVLDRVNDTTAPVPDTGVAGLVAARAARQPDAVAVVCGDEVVTYRDLDRRAARLAGRLAARGAGPERLVAVRLPRGADLVVALLAVWRTGAGFVALDPDLPPRRIADVLADARPDLELTELPALDGGPEPPPRPVHPDGRAYVVYTSGTTGTPKGITGTHRGVANYLADLSRAGLVTPADTAVALTTVSFDASLRDLLLPLALGARVVLVPGGAADLDAVAGAIAEATVVPAVVPSLLRVLTTHGRQWPHLRTVLVSGEPLHPEDVAAVAAVAPGAVVHNLYGPSETTMTTTRHRVRPGGADRIPVGTPIGNTRVEVLDERLRPAGIGVPGRVFIGGAGLARGYHGQPGRTAERFVPDPVRPGERLYDTGDRARFLPDGTLQYLGRADHQLKVNGVRIDPSEIEAALCAHPAIAEAAVHAPGGRLVACVVAARALPAAHRIRAELADRLPTTHIPAAFVRLDRLPRTTTGKVRRDALPEPEAEAVVDQHPRDSVEELIARVWCDVLGVPEVGVHQDFFALGGHSLLAARTVAGLREALGVVLPVRALFESPTVAELAVRVGDADADPLPEFVAGAGEPVLTAAQRRLWSLEQRCGRYAFYNVPIVRRLRGELDHDALAAALTGLVARHDALRTVFPAQGPRVRPPGPVPLEVVDVAAADMAGQVAARVGRPFDLANGPLLRATLLREGERDHVLCVVIHHLVADGWSVGVVLRDLTALYRSTVDLPPVARYADFAAWQRSYLTDEFVAAELGHWRGELAGAGPLFALPPDYPRLTGAGRPPRGRVTRTLTAGESARVRELCRRLRATPFMVLMAAFQAALGARFGRDDFTVAVPMANRDRPELDAMVGYVANMVVLRADLTGLPDFATLVDRTRARVLDAHTHRHLPLELLLDDLAPEQAESHAPLAQALFNMQDFPHRDVDVDRLAIERTGLNEVWARYPITLFAHDRPGGVFLDLVHDQELFDPVWAAAFLDAMVTATAEVDSDDLAA